MKCILFFYSLLVLSNAGAQDADSLIASLKDCRTDSAKVASYNAIAEASFATENDSIIFKYTRLAYDLIQKHYRDQPKDSVNVFFKKNEALALNNFGYEYYQKGQPLKGLHYFKMAVAKYKSINERDGLHGSLMNIAATLESEGDLEDAIRYYKELIAEFEHDVNKKNLADNLSNLATSYANSYDYPKADETYRRALAYYLQSGDSIYYLQTLKNVADVQMVLGDSVKAYDYYTQSLSLAKRFNDQKTIASCENSLANIYQNKPDYITAEKYYLHAFDILTKLNDLVGQATLLRNYAAMLLRRQEPKKALVLADSALRVGQRSGSLVNIRDEAALLSLIHKALGNEAAYQEMNNLYKVMGDSIDHVDARKQAAFKKFREDYEHYEENLNKKEDVAGLGQSKMGGWSWVIVSAGVIALLGIVVVVRRRNDS